MTMPEQIMLRDLWDPLVDAGSQVFEPFAAIDVAKADFFAEDADALVSPANSFGIMDGGLDLAIRSELGHHVQKRVQDRILADHHGEIAVGAAFVVPTDHTRWPYLVVAPTMRVPEPSAHTLNAYLAFRAVLLSVAAFNAREATPRIASIVVPGFCTGIGGMDARRCAAQMRMAYDQVTKPARIPSFDMIHKLHHKLRSAE